MAIKPLDLTIFNRLINHGPTTLISAQVGADRNVMACSWSCTLDFFPTPKLTAVISATNYTRKLIEQSGYFVVQVPTRRQVRTVLRLGSTSKNYQPAKVDEINFWYADGYPEHPLVADCAGWLLCKVIPEPHNQNTYDLFIGEVLAAFADDEIFADGMWKFATADKELHSMHYMTDGQFHYLGEQETIVLSEEELKGTTKA